MIIVFVSFSALTVMLTSIVNEYEFTMKQRLMENTAQSIGSMINVSMRMGHIGFGSMLESEGVQINDILNRNAENSDSVIFVSPSLLI